jgi:pimeloyl-ACP methyl ester carboxylesterase
MTELAAMFAPVADNDRGGAQNSTMERTARVLGVSLHYREAGAGKIVLLLHGLGGDGSRWQPTISALANQYRVIAPDQVGFGRSDKPVMNYDVGVLSEFLVAFLDAIGISRASLVGNSIGAAVAASTAVHFPHRVERLVLVDGAGYRRGRRATPWAPRLRQIQRCTSLDDTRENIRLMVYDKALVTDRLVAESFASRAPSALVVEKIQSAIERRVGGITDEEMRSIKIPTLIVWGKEDELAGPPGRTAERLRRDIAGSELAVIAEAGHMPQFERPEEFNRLLREFLNRTDAVLFRQAEPTAGEREAANGQDATRSGDR